MGIKKIAVFTFEYPPILGGAGTFAYDLINSTKDEDIIVKLVLLRIDKKEGFFLKSLFSICQSFYKVLFFDYKKFDYIILNDGRSKRIFSIVSLFLNSKIFSKLIFIFHGNEENVLFNSASFISTILNIPKQLIYIIERSRGVVVFSLDQKMVYKDFSYNFYKKLRVIPHSVDQEVFKKFSSDKINLIRKESNLTDKDLILFSASRLVNGKGQDFVIQSLKKIIDKGFNVMLLIAGTGVHCLVLKKLVQDLGLNNNVTFLGSVDRKELKYYYNLADIFVLTSKLKESFGLVYIESFACGTPAISSNFGGVIEIIEHKKNGFLVDPYQIGSLENTILDILNKKYDLQLLKNEAFNTFKLKFNHKSNILRIINEFS